MSLSGVLIVTVACVYLPTAPSDDSLPVLGACGLLPNYVESGLADQQPPRLLRWRDFPVRVHVDSRGAPDALRPVYDAAAMRGTESWSTVTDGRIGRASYVSTPSAAQIVVRFVFGTGTTASAATTAQFSGRLLIRATTAVNRPAGDIEQLERGDEDQVTRAIVQMVGHEMGHALGILLHSPDPGDLIARVIQVSGDGNGITPSDHHTLLQAYCQ